MNKFKSLAIPCALTGILLSSTASFASEKIGDESYFYGKFNLSLDVASGGSSTGTDTSVSSNSSRLGFKGHHSIDDSMSAVWKLEQEVDFGLGAKTSNTFSTRNSYAGLKTSYGTVLAGIHDTPFKLAGTKWGLFGDTVGDLRAILGASPTKHNVMNQRGKNAIMYKNKFAGMKIFLMRATDAMNADNGRVDGSVSGQNSLSSGMVKYALSDLTFTVAAERWDDLKGYGAITGERANVKYKGDGFAVGALLENIKADKTAGKHLDHTAFGANGSYKMGANTLKAEFLKVGDNATAANNNTGATKTSIGVDHKLDKNTKLYATYTVTSNDNNAQFQGADGGHGDELKAAAAGDSPSAFSLGLVFKF